MSGEIDPVALEHRLTTIEASIQASGRETQSALGKVVTSVDGLAAKVGQQNGRVGILEASEAQRATRGATKEAREEGRVEVKRRHLALAGGGFGYLAATGVDVTISDQLQMALVIAAAIVLAIAILGRTLTDVLGKRPSGPQPDPEDRRGEAD